MIQQIYITDYLSDAAAQPAEMIQTLIAQCPLLLRGQWQQSALPPLKALWRCLGVDAVDVAAILSAKERWSTTRPAFCLLPVHLGLRRDTFSLQSVVPITADGYFALTQRLKQHFCDDFIVHEDSSRRYWWVQPLREVDAKVKWPQDCLYQQALQWQPQGEDAALIRQWTNEMQMLLHEGAYSASGSPWPEALNSLWMASVAELPTWPQPTTFIGGQGAVFAGLQASHVPGIQVTSLHDMMGKKKSASGLWVEDEWQRVDWQGINHAIAAGQISELQVVLPFAERSVHIHYKKQRRWQFWRKQHSVESLLQQLETELTVIR